MNTRMILRQAAEELRQTGVPDPEYDSGWMLSAAMGVRAPLELKIGAESDPTSEEMEIFRAMMSRRKQREPLQYILGTAWFMGYEFKVRPGVLIPRPETELLARWAADELKARCRRTAFRSGTGSGYPEKRECSGRRQVGKNAAQGHPFPGFPGTSDAQKVLDLCCGSGCLGISLKKEVPSALVTMTDLSPEALEIARENAGKLDVRCEILQGDLFAPVIGQSFDLIISNPPYIPSGACDLLQKEVLREPRMALDGGTDGIQFYRRIAEEVGPHLNPGGILMMELGIQEAEEVDRLLLNNGAEYTEIRKDDAGIDRMILAAYACLHDRNEG